MTSPETSRRLNRSTMKNEQHFIDTGTSFRTEAKLPQQDEFLSCEITSICNQNKTNVSSLKHLIGLHYLF